MPPSPWRTALANSAHIAVTICGSSEYRRRSGSRGALPRPGPLRTVRAALTAHGSSKPVRVGRFVVIRPFCDGPRSVHRRSGVQLVLGFSHLSQPHLLAHLLLSAPFRVGHKPVSGQLSADAPVKADACVPAVSCRLSTHRHSLLEHPWPAEELGLPHGRLTGTPTAWRTSTGFPRSTRARHDRGGCPLYPEDGGAHPAGNASPAGTWRFTAASPWTPPAPSHRWSFP